MGPSATLILILTGLALAAAAWRRLQLRTCAVLPAGNAGGSWRLSVIVPARNEARNLPRLLDSLRRQTRTPLEIIVVDDGSEDATADVARRHGARVVTSLPLPPDWRGKPWACHQGAEAASGNLLLFLDADTWLQANGLETLTDRFPAAGGAISLLPYHVMTQIYEQLSAGFNLIMAWSVGALTPCARAAKQNGLFGQSLCIDRTHYRQSGGYAAVRNQMLENLNLAQHLRKAGIPLQALGGAGVLCMQLYPDGLRSLIAGWAKTFAQGTEHSPKAARLGVGIWIALGWVIVGGLGWASAIRPLSPHAGAWALLALGYAGLTWRWLKDLGTYTFTTALLFPVPLLFFLLVFRRSARIARGRMETEWKGRRIRLSDKAEP